MDADREFDPNTVVHCFSRQNNRHPLLHQRKLIGWSTTKVGKLVLPSRNVSLLFSLLSIIFIPPSLSLSLSLCLSLIQNQIYRQSISLSFLPTTPHYLYVCLSINRFLRPTLPNLRSIYLSIYLSVQSPCIPPTIRPSFHPVAHPSDFPPICHSLLTLLIYLYVCFSICLSIPPPAAPYLLSLFYLSIYLSITDGWMAG